MFTVETKQLKTALEDVKRFVSSKSTLPVLHNVLIDSLEGDCRITSTNLENTLEKLIPCEGEITPF